MKKFATMLCAAVMAFAMTFSVVDPSSPSADVVTTTEITTTVDGGQVICRVNHTEFVVSGDIIY